MPLSGFSEQKLIDVYSVWLPTSTIRWQTSDGYFKKVVFPFSLDFREKNVKIIPKEDWSQMKILSVLLTQKS